jgi:DNA polymerase III epsilon subunit family exonuclease
MTPSTPNLMQRSLNRFRDSGKPVDLVELAQQLLAVETAIDPALARRIVGLALNREPQSLPDQLRPGDFRSGDEIEVADGKIASADFVVVDLETTGLDVNGAAILEIGAIRLSQLRIVDRFETLLRPPGKLPRAIVALTGIHDAMVAEAPPQKRALRSFARWLDRTPTAPFVAHNASFDHRFVSRALDLCGLPPYRGAVLCTRKLARRLIPELGRYNLDQLCAHFGIANRARHRALGDAEATARALLDLLEIAQSRFEIGNLGELIDFQRRPPAKRKPRRRRETPGRDLATPQANPQDSPAKR